MKELQEKGVYATCAITKGRVPLGKEVKAELVNTQRGDMRFWKAEQDTSKLLITFWKDKKELFFVSNYYNNEKASIQRRENMVRDVEDEKSNKEDESFIDFPNEYFSSSSEEDSDNEDSEDKMEIEVDKSPSNNSEDSDQVNSIQAPKMVVEYSQFMKGVDKFNQNCAYYRNTHRSFKWYRSIIIWLLEISINNSYLLYEKMLGKDAMDTLSYRMSIIEEWEEIYSNERNIPERVSNPIEECQLGHFDDNRKGDCKYCSNRSIGGVRVTTTWFCMSCKICVCPKCAFLHFKEKYGL